jgi:hypothetical protein
VTIKLYSQKQAAGHISPTGHSLLIPDLEQVDSPETKCSVFRILFWFGKTDNMIHCMAEDKAEKARHPRI